METLWKTYRAEVKEVDENEGTVDMFIPVSTDSVDRDGEIVEPMAFKKTIPKFMKRPVLVASHDYRDLTSQIGEWSKLKIEETGLNGKPKYYINAGNEQADWGFYLASKGMAAFSIGFIPKVWEDGDGVKEPRRTYKEVELLEISQVIVPSNREAIQSIRAKSVDPIITELCDEIEKELPKGEPEIVKEIVTKPEETDDFIHIPVRDAGQFQPDSFRTIDIDKDKGIKAVIGRLKGETKTTVQKYIFDKSKGWTMAKAKEWVKEHEGKSYEPHEVSQSEIIDEIDYLKSLIEKEGLSDEAKLSADGLIELLLKKDDLFGELAERFPADDIAVKDTFTNQDILESIKRIGGK